MMKSLCGFAALLILIAGVATGCPEKSATEKTVIAPSTETEATPGVTPPATATPAPLTSPAAAVTYTCPMHPEVVSNQPGNCPKCGMSLIVKK